MSKSPSFLETRSVVARQHGAVLSAFFLLWFLCGCISGTWGGFWVLGLGTIAHCQNCRVLGLELKQKRKAMILQIVTENRAIDFTDIYIILNHECEDWPFLKRLVYGEPHSTYHVLDAIKELTHLENLIFRDSLKLYRPLNYPRRQQKSANIDSQDELL